MKALEITGRQRACGTIQVEGNKNAALPMVAATLLTDEPVVLHNVPDILDVKNMLALAVEMGVSVRKIDESTVELCAKGFCNAAAQYAHRSSSQARWRPDTAKHISTSQGETKSDGGGSTRTSTGWEDSESTQLPPTTVFTTSNDAPRDSRGLRCS